MIEYAKDLKSWSKQKELKFEGAVVEGEPEADILTQIKAQHPQLEWLYKDNAGLAAFWENENEERAGIYIPDPGELLESINWEREDLSKYTKEDLEECEQELPGGKGTIDIIRSLVPFISEGNGDKICISLKDNAIYFWAHDWMDWVSSDPPAFKISDDIKSFYNNWSKIGFSNPKDLWWMNTISNGAFIGFNSDAFDIP